MNIENKCQHKNSYNKSFIALLVTQFLGALNDNIFKNALIILITFSLAERAGVSVQTYVVLSAAIFILPFFLFSSTTGQFSDKYPKDRVIVYTKLLEIFIMILALFALWLSNLYLLLFVLFLLGTQSTIFGPAKYSVVPELISNNELVKGNGQLNALTFLAILIGTIIGGELVARQYGIYYIGGLTIVVAVVGYMSSLKIPKLTAKNPELIVNYNMIQTTHQMIQDVKIFTRRSKMTDREYGIAILILSISWFWFVGATFLSQLPTYVTKLLFGNERMVTILLTSFALGIGVGSLLCAQINKHYRKFNLTPISLFGMAFFGFELYFATKHYNQGSTLGILRVMMDFIFLAIFAGMYVVPLEAKLQILAPERKRARIIAAANIVNAFFMVMSALILILLSLIKIGVVGSFIIISVVNVLLGLYSLKSTVLNKNEHEISN